MKKYCIYLVISGLISWACSEEAVRKPAKLINRDHMVGILVDIHLSDAAFQTRRYTSEDLKRYNESDFYYSVLKKHNLADSVFETSLLYYSGKPKEFEKIYTRVVNRLTEMEQQEMEKSREPVNLDNRTPE
jgi:hypothetical protein